MSASVGEHDRHQTFETLVESSLLQAEQLSGRIQVIPGSRWYTIMYIEGSPSDPGSDLLHPEESKFVTYRDIADDETQNSLTSGLSELQRVARLSAPYIVTRRKALVLVKALGLPDIQPPDFGTVTGHTLTLMPELAAAQEAHDHPYQTDIGRILVRRALSLAPPESIAAFSNIGQRYQEIRACAPNTKVLLIDRFMNGVSGQLERMVSVNVTEHSDAKLRPAPWEYPVRGKHAVSNTVDALEVLDEKGIVPPKFWLRLLNVPLASQTMAVTELLADKVSSESAAEVLDNSVQRQLSRFVENVVGAALERGVSHTARDQNKLTTIRDAVVGNKTQPDSISLGKVVGLANILIKQGFGGRLTPLRTDGSLTDVSQALSLLLNITLKTDAPAAERDQANKDAAIYVRLAAALIEQTATQQKPVIRTIGDLALRYGDATDDERLELLTILKQHNLLTHVDALRRQQLRGKRRAQIMRPGYGQIS